MIRKSVKESRREAADEGDDPPAAPFGSHEPRLADGRPERALAHVLGHRGELLGVLDVLGRDVVLALGRLADERRVIKKTRRCRATRTRLITCSSSSDSSSFFGGGAN